MKIRPVGAENFDSDGRTNKTKLTVAFRNFANVPKNSFVSHSRVVTLGKDEKTGFIPVHTNLKDKMNGETPQQSKYETIPYML